MASLVQKISDYQVVVVGAGISSWALVNALPDDLRVLVVEGSGVGMGAVKHRGIFDSFERASISSVGILGGLSGNWNGHLYTPDPTPEELSTWPKQLAETVLKNLAWAGGLLRQDKFSAPAMRRFYRISSSHPPDIRDPVVWPANVDFLHETFVTKLIEEEGSVVGFFARTSGSDTESEFRARDASFVVAAGGVQTSEILSESFFPHLNSDGIREHLIGPLGRVKIPAGFFGKGEGKVNNAIAVQVQTSVGGMTRSTNVIFRKSYENDSFRLTRLSILLKFRRAALRMVDYAFPRRPIWWEPGVSSEILPSKAFVSRSSCRSAGNARAVEVHCSPSADDWDALDKVIVELLGILGLPGGRRHLESQGLFIDRGKFGGGGHYLCATPASSDPGAFVGLDLKVRNLSNLWACSSSVFPSGIAANPTKIICALSKGVADQIANDLDVPGPERRSNHESAR